MAEVLTLFSPKADTHITVVTACSSVLYVAVSFAIPVELQTEGFDRRLGILCTTVRHVATCCHDVRGDYKDADG